MDVSTVRQAVTGQLGHGTEHGTNKIWSTLAALFVASFCLFVILANAWVSDDGFITFRSVEQLFAGNGPRWNPHERVQAFTHPLWFGLLCLVRLFTKDVFLNVLFVSMTSCVVACFLLGRIALSRWHWAICMLILGSSKALVDFSTSGLENPLSHLMILAFLFVLLRSQSEGIRSHRDVVALTFLLGLAVTVRLDLVPLLLAPYLYALVSTLKSDGHMDAPLVGKLALALLPPIAWTIFSLIYYGFPFPNTAYAKLGAGVPTADLLPHGISYLANSLRLDAITLVIIVTSVVASFTTRRGALMALAIGIVCHLLYVVRVGGDFMSGRFLTPELVMAVGILGAIDWRRGVVPMALVGLMFYNFAQPLAPWWTRGTYSNTEIDSAGIADERGFYFQYSSIWRYVESVQSGTHFPKMGWVDDAVEFARSNYKATVMPAIGYFGYYVRLDQIVIDPMALSDPLLARLPARSDWRIGHMVRDIPEGYLESIVGDQNRIKDPAVRALYDKLELVTKGPLFTADRWRAIWALNMGW